VKIKNDHFILYYFKNDFIFFFVYKFKMYGLILFIQYLIAYNILNKKHWDKFTRLISTINAIQCISMVYNETFYTETVGLYNIYYIADEKSLKSLYFFASYLFVDGIFQLFDKLSLNLILSLLHHFVGGLGIYIIADTQMGFFLGYYFAMTEFSTIFLNLYWFYRKKFILIIFYIFFVICRIFTSPILFEFLSANSQNISTVEPLYYNMVYYGIYTLTILNFIWFVFLTKKVIS
jgi:hypothetical protein